MSMTIAEPQLSDKHRPRANLKAWLVCLTAGLFFFYEFVQMNMFNAIAPELMRTFAIDAAELSLLFSYFHYANMFFLLPAGLMLDRLSTRKLIIMGMICCIFSAFIFSVASAVWQAKVARFLAGFANSFCFLSCIRLASRWFPSRQMALITSLIVTMAMLGGIVAQAPMTSVVLLVGWRKALLYDACGGLAILMIIMLVVRDFPANQEQNHDAEQVELDSISLLQSLLLAARNPQNWLCGIYVSLLNLPIFILGGVWGGMFLTQVHQLTRIQATDTTAMVFLGTVVGSPIFGTVSDGVKNRRLPMLWGAVASVVVIYFIMTLQQPSLLTLTVLFALLGFTTSSQVIGYPVVVESNPPMLTGTASSLSAILIMGGGALAPVFGQLLNMHWDGHLFAGVAQYSAADYHFALMMLPAGFFIGLLAVLFIKETKCEMLPIIKSN